MCVIWNLGYKSIGKKEKSQNTVFSQPKNGVSAGFKHMLKFDFSPAQANGNMVIN